MRLLRRVIPPANTGLCQKFQQFRIIEALRSHKHTAWIEKSNLANGSNVQWLLKPYVTSALTNTVEVKKPRRTVSKNERKSLLENYVRKYREMNAGKFPFICEAQKEVGGSFYVIREIIQELKFKGPTTLEKGRLKNEISADIGEVSQPECVDEGISLASEVHIRHSGSNGYKLKEGSRHSVAVTNDQSNDISTQPFQQTDKATSSLDPELAFHKFQPKTEPQESTESETSKRESGQLHSEDAESQRKSSVWQNLKSFASGIFSRWKGS